MTYTDTEFKDIYAKTLKRVISQIDLSNRGLDGPYITRHESYIWGPTNEFHILNPVNRYPIRYPDRTYKSILHAYYAMRCRNVADRVPIEKAEFGLRAAWAGQMLEPRPHWPTLCPSILTQITCKRILSDIDAVRRLMQTKKQGIVYVSRFSDSYMGVKPFPENKNAGRGYNLYGVILMALRYVINQEDRIARPSDSGVVSYARSNKPISVRPVPKKPTPTCKSFRKEIRV